MRKIQHATNLFAMAALVFALWLGYRELQAYSIQQLAALMVSFPASSIVSAIGLTILSYIILASYDWVALLHLRKKIPLSRILLVGSIGYAVSNNAGHAVLTGGSMRYRFYSSWGLNGLEIAQIILLSTITYFLAVGSMLAGSYVLSPVELFSDNHLAGGSLHAIMLGVTIALGIYWMIVLSGKRELSIRGRDISLPSPSITILQTIIGICDLLLAACVLYVLLIQHVDIPFSIFINAYLIAQIIGLFSQVPGGLGVFEGAFLYVLGSTYPAGEVIASLLMYRVIYYFLPLLSACGTLLAYEIHKRKILKDKFSLPVAILSRSVPQIFSILMLIAGSILLLSGNTPGDADRLEMLSELFGLEWIETSHLISSIVGLMLLVLARAIRLKLNAAYYATVLLLVIGIIASLIKGFDFEEATLLLIMLALFIPSHHTFYRKSRLTQVALTPQWIMMIALILGIATWLGLFSYKHVEYSHELWWQFALHGDAPRFLRSTMAVAVISCAILLYQLFKTSHQKPHQPNQEELQAAEIIIKTSPDSSHFLALTGDKNLLWSKSGQSFLSYAIHANYWIAMGDPCGIDEEKDELAWKFREEADRFGAKAVFYQVSADNLPLYLDLGLTLVKLGEEAHINLPTFSLEGRARASLRQRVNKMEREECSFDILRIDELPAHLQELEIISNNWLGKKKSSEKGFSLGHFSRDYLLRNPVAVVRHEGEIVAFANLWLPENKNEMSIDLMRYSDKAPSGVMEYLTTKLMLWGKDQGYHYFNLGMSPLSGLERHPLAPMWHKIGNTIYHYGNEFYNFDGLRLYKDRFLPEWRPRYIATPSDINLPLVMFSVTSLISGGIRGIFSK